jgi:hypothetical protein
MRCYRFCVTNLDPNLKLQIAVMPGDDERMHHEAEDADGGGAWSLYFSGRCCFISPQLPLKLMFLRCSVERYSGKWSTKSGFVGAAVNVAALQKHFISVTLFVGVEEVLLCALDSAKMSR